MSNDNFTRLRVIHIPSSFPILFFQPLDFSKKKYPFSISPNYCPLFFNLHTLILALVALPFVVKAFFVFQSFYPGWLVPSIGTLTFLDAWSFLVRTLFANFGKESSFYSKSSWILLLLVTTSLTSCHLGFGSSCEGRFPGYLCDKRDWMLVSWDSTSFILWSFLAIYWSMVSWRVGCLSSCLGLWFCMVWGLYIPWLCLKPCPWLKLLGYWL